MKRILVLGSILLSGCGYSFSEIEKAKEVCIKHNGEFIVGTVGSLVTGISCKVDGIRYRIGRTSFELLEARK